MSPRAMLVRRAAPVLAIAAAIGAAVILPRADAFDRLYSTSVAEETRIAFVPTLLRVAADFFPFGSGFGSFDPVFRFYEPDDLLARTYLNHAHNDLLELVITGGLPALLVAFAFLFWAARRCLSTVRHDRNSRRGRFATLASVIIVLALLSSLVDYPLRTPAFAMIFAFACGWLGAGRGRDSADGVPG